jgi:hypothetical protein
MDGIAQHGNICHVVLFTAEIRRERRAGNCGGSSNFSLRRRSAGDRALIVANEYLESEAAELMKAVSRAYARGRFGSYSG